MGPHHAFPSFLLVCVCTCLGNRIPHCEGSTEDPVIGSLLSGSEEGIAEKDGERERWRDKLIEMSREQNVWLETAENEIKARKSAVILTVQNL